MANFPKYIITSGLTTWLDVNNPASYPGSGTTITDLSPHAGSASIVNGATYSSSNGGIALNGSNQYIYTTNDLGSYYSSTSESFFVWVYPTSPGQIVLETSFYGNWHDSQIEMHSDGTIHFSVWHDNSFYSNKVVSSPQPFNQWYLLGLTYDNATQTQTAYINGKVVGSHLVSRDAPYNHSIGLQYRLGAADSTNMGVNQYLNGVIASFYAYNRALTPAEVYANYYFLYNVNNNSYYLSLSSFSSFSNNAHLYNCIAPFTLTIDPTDSTATNLVYQIDYDFGDGNTFTDNGTLSSNNLIFSPQTYTYNLLNIFSQTLSATVSLYQVGLANPLVYNVEVNLKSPVLEGNSGYFDELHLVGTRMFGSNNDIVYMFESINPNYVIPALVNWQSKPIISIQNAKASSYRPYRLLAPFENPNLVDISVATDLIHFPQVGSEPNPDDGNASDIEQIYP